MAEESQMRKDVREDSCEILYEDERYLIGVCKRGENSHNILVNDAYAYFDRGIFNELSRADTRRLRSSLEMVGERVLNEMVTKNIPLEELGWALAKAAIKNEENFASYLVNQREGIKSI